MGRWPEAVRWTAAAGVRVRVKVSIHYAEKSFHFRLEIRAQEELSSVVVVENVLTCAGRTAVGRAVAA
jgi:hypothetical protein